LGRLLPATQPRTGGHLIRPRPRRLRRADFDLLNRVLDADEPAANHIANTVAVSFVEQRERVIRQQQDSIRELSTPVLQVRERLLIPPIIGILDRPRAQQLTGIDSEAQ
jgi:rsbT co-antagonist protein RsbR